MRQSTMENTETLATLGKQETRRRQNKINKDTQKTKKTSTKTMGKSRYSRRVISFRL